MYTYIYVYISLPPDGYAHFCRAAEYMYTISQQITQDVLTPYTHADTHTHTCRGNPQQPRDLQIKQTFQNIQDSLEYIGLSRIQDFLEYLSPLRKHRTFQNTQDFLKYIGLSRIYRTFQNTQDFLEYIGLSRAFQNTQDFLTPWRQNT